jgi:hypothetical protein
LTAVGTFSTTALSATTGTITLLNTAQGADIASAGTTDIGAATGNAISITGTITITALGTATAGAWRIVTFTGVLTLTHNATSLILPGAANIATAAGDTAVFVSLGSGNWRCANYQRLSGIATADIANSAVTNAKMANMAANTVKTNNTASPAVPSDVALAASQILGRASTGNIAGFTTPDDLTYISTRLSLQGADKKRQIILNAPVDTSGYNSMLPATSGSLSITTQNITTSAPLVVTAGASYNQFGDQSNRKGFATANLTFSGNTASIGISSITRSTTTATLTTSAAHNLVTGSEVTVSGATPAGYNGTYIITVTGATTFTYVMAADPGANASPVGSYTVTNFLWVDVGTDGVLTTGRTLLPPIYTQGSTPPTTANQFTYNITEAKGYYGNGSTAPQTYKVFVGEVQASTATITSSVAYAVNGYYDSGFTAPYPGPGVVISKNHNLGFATALKVDLIVVNVTANMGYVPDQYVYNPQGSNAAYVYNAYPRLLRNSLGHTTASSNGITLVTVSTGISTDATVANWKYKFIVERTW